MAQSGAHEAGHGGGMEITSQRETFHGFLVATIWTCTHIAQLVLLLTIAFAIGLGWWPGLSAFVVVGIAAGLIFRMSGAYWAAQIVQWVLLGIGGMIVPALAGMMG